ncbi:MAG TPA: serine/threonine protein kinase [Polyangiaceae bacterium]|nr:serine/threonine protein kinase [Polyangiaceae bacterium]
MPSSSPTSDGEAPTLASSSRADALPEALAEHLDEDLEPGTEVGEYVIEGKLGEGGFGTVYRAKHPLIGKTAAIKVLAREYSSNREMVSRFVAEARAVNTIRHTNIIDIFSFGTLEDGRHYFVMELLDGGTVDQFLADNGPLEPALALALLRGVARALDAAHDSGIVHRDLKPENIFLTFDDDGRPVPKLLDFGIAKLTGDAKAISGHKTRTGAPIGTPQYMSPEQCVGGPVTERSDVYAFGVVTFELLTGEPPFTDTSFLGLMNKQATAPRPAASSVNDRLPAAFDGAIAKMMAIEPAERPARAGAAHELLLQAARAAELDVDQPVSMPEAQRRPTATLTSAATQPANRFSSDPRPPASSRTIAGEDRATTPPWGWFIGAMAILVVIGVVAARDGGEAPTTPATTSEPTAPPSIEAVVGAPPSAPQTATVTAATNEPSVATITVRSAVPSATVYLDERRLGPVPGPFEIGTPDNLEHRLVVKAPGHTDASVERTLNDGDTIFLDPAPIRRPVPHPAGTVDRDLEDPY